METQKDFDVEKYLGKWYQIGISGDPIFQRDCSFATAEYSKGNEGIIVKNTCLDENGKEKRVALGKATIPNMNDRSKLKVDFGYFPGNYYCHWTDYNRYSIVGGGDNKTLWILSRFPKISKHDVSFLLRKVKEFGYDPDMVMSNKNLVY